MTRSLLTTEFRPGSADRLQRYVALARGILAVERLWPALWPATGILGLGLAAALFDLFTPIAWPLHALILACFETTIGLTLYLNLRHLRMPHWMEGARRLERDSDLKHRPISEADDVIAAGAGDPEAEELWRAHMSARLNRLEKLRLALPHSDLPKKDPRALRYGVLLLLVAALFVAGSDSTRRLAAAFTPNAGAIATLDAWVEPPAYTGEAPVYLGQNAKLSVPVGSILHLRVHGADHRPSATLDNVSFTGGDGEYAGEGKLLDSGRVRIRAGGHSIGNWKITIIPDKPPTIAFAERPSATERQALKIVYKASDDYGVTSARAVIRPHGRPGAPLIVDLQLPDRAAKNAALTTFRDLTEHPYAGLDVDITLQAMDAAGNTATSNTVTFRLPQRLFTDPLARALIEQRQNLASMGLAAKTRVGKMLEALTLAPELFYQGKEGIYLALRSALHSVEGAQTPDDYRRVQDLLWQTAVALEHGGLLTMAEQLRRLQQMIIQAMAQGAPQSEIDELLRRYNELMQQYLTALAQNAPDSGGSADPNAKMLGAGDLDALIKAIQQLSQAGDRLKAMQLMAMLQSLLENVQIAGGGQSGDQASNQALRALGDIMGRQRGLLDKTFREGNGSGDPKDGGAKGLSQQQGQLKNDLDSMQKKFGGKKNPAQGNLDKAERLMGEAQDALKLSDLPRAGTLQKYVLDELRKSAEAMAKAAGQGQSAQGSDPLGRNTGNSARGGSDMKIPDASVLQRARDILMELRKRAGQQGRPKEELDYIDRLLKQF